MTEELKPCIADTESPDTPTQLRALAVDKVACTFAYGSDLRRAADEIERLRNTRAPKVKPLVWEGKAGSGDYLAKCSLTGRWMVLHMPNDVFIADGPEGRTISEHDNETDALEACEENRLARILSALEQ